MKGVLGPKCCKVYKKVASDIQGDLLGKTFQTHLVATKYLSQESNKMISIITFRTKCIPKHSQRMPETFLHEKVWTDWKL